MKPNLITTLPTIRHPGESRGPLNSCPPSSASRVALIQGSPAFARMTMYGGMRAMQPTRSVRNAG
jgi:hypothetical protein